MRVAMAKTGILGVEFEGSTGSCASCLLNYVASVTMAQCARVWRLFFGIITRDFRDVGKDKRNEDSKFDHDGNGRFDARGIGSGIG
jgi:hypothetical protein